MPHFEPITAVLACDHAYIAGGQAKVMFDSARGLKALGHRPIIFAAAGPVESALREDGIEVVCLGQADILSNPSRANAALQGLWNAPAAAALAQLLAGLPKARTVVHVHGWAKALSPSIAGPIKRSGLPACYTLHEYFLFCPNGGFYNFQTQKICPLEPMSARCLATHCDSRSYPQKLWRSARQFAMQSVADLPGAFGDYVLVSPFQRAIAKDRFPASARVHLISNPIDAADLGPKPEAAQGEFLFAGRISPEKGPLFFAEAARRAGVTPVFAGDGPAAAELRAKYPEAKLLGWLAPAQMRDAMRGARALVFPSLWYEAQGLTALEAKALATPVLVSDACAAREEIEDGVAGLWFASGDVESLAAGLKRLQDDELTRRLSSGAYRSFWGRPPSLQEHAAAISRLYFQMLARRKN